MSVRWLVLGLALALARPAAAQGSFEERIAAASARVARQPGNAEALVARGELYRQHRDFERALADFEAAARALPPAESADLLRGRTLIDAGRARQAVAPLDRYLELHPDSAAGYLERARAHEAVAAPQSAAEDYERAMEAIPHPTAEQYLRRMHLQLAADRLEAALGGLDEGIARLGPLPELEEPALTLELQARRWDAALARLQTLAPSEGSVRFAQRRGEILLQAGRRAEARLAFRAALQAIAALPAERREALAAVERKLRRQLSEASRPGAGGSSRPRGR